MVAFEGTAFFGPVVTPAPKGEAAVAEAAGTLKIEDDADGKRLVITRDDELSILSVRNLAYVHVLYSDQLNAYDVLVSGSQAVNLVDAAKASGNIRITFAGRYRITEWRGDQGTRIQHEVRADEVSVSLLGQRVTVERPRGDVASKESTSF